MIQFEKFVLDNGLTVIVEEDKTTPFVAVNTLYKVGAKHEDPDKTGLAHIFEHLMFSGSLNINSFEENLYKAGGTSNAFTNNDFTNYYCQLPAANIETALWLESDRMVSLNFNENKLATQKEVVLNEFNQNYINKPYGNAWSILRKLAFTQHPYQWITIGKDPLHIQGTTLLDIKEFYYKFYRPNNAILSIVGNVKTEKIKYLVNKWYGTIPNGNIRFTIPTEPPQNALRKIEIQESVPHDYLLMAWKSVERLSNKYHTMDLLSYLLGHGETSILYQELVKKRKLFSFIQCFHLGNLEPSLFVICGLLNKDITMLEAETAINEIVNKIKTEKFENEEIQKSINKIETIKSFEKIQILNRAEMLAYYELLGDTNYINIDFENYKFIETNDVYNFANDIFINNNLNILNYYAQPI